jgi:hypothetical protein
MLEADIEENGGGSSFHSDTEDDAYVYTMSPYHYSNNEIRLHNGQHVALGQICSDTTVEFISCNSLEYDTII